MKAINYLLAFIGGAAVGAACGLLFAPEKGSDTRERIAEALRKRGIRLNKKEMSNLQRNCRLLRKTQNNIQTNSC